MVMMSHYRVFPLAGRGWVGVDLFFVLSGFLISGLLFSEMHRHGGISIGRFYLRRGFKIYPGLYALLAIMILFGDWLLKPLQRDFVVDALFLQNYLTPSSSHIHVLGHLWSLAVEEHFYLILPLVLVLLNRAKIMHFIPLIAVALIALCFCLRVPYSRTHGFQIFVSHLRMDALFAGVAIGYLHHLREDLFVKFSRWWIPLPGLALLLPLISGLKFPSLVMTCNLLSFSLILGWSAQRIFPWSGWLAAIGRYSYSIYLWHLPIASIWKRWPMTWLGLATYIIASLLVGVLAALVIEFPALRLRDRLTSKRATSVGQSAAAGGTES